MFWIRVNHCVLKINKKSAQATSHKIVQALRSAWGIQLFGTLSSSVPLKNECWWHAHPGLKLLTFAYCESAETSVLSKRNNYKQLAIGRTMSGRTNVKKYTQPLKVLRMKWCHLLRHRHLVNPPKPQNHKVVEPLRSENQTGSWRQAPTNITYHKDVRTTNSHIRTLLQKLSYTLVLQKEGRTEKLQQKKIH